MPADDPTDEITISLDRLIAQARGGEGTATSRIFAAVSAKTYLEALTRRLVNEAREEGATWDEIALLFGTSPVNAKARYGDYNDYGGD